MDTELLSGDDSDECLWLGGPVSRGQLRGLVSQWEQELANTGLSPGGTVALRLPPSLTFVASLLAAWRIGAQVSLLDHRLTRYEADQAVQRLAPEVLVEPTHVVGSAMRGYADVVAAATARPDGSPAQTPHALVQLSSGSTGPSKVIARTAADVVGELHRYDSLGEYPRGGERIVLLASMVHVLGLVGGLLYSLHAGLQLAIPDRLTADGILGTVAASERPTIVLGVPFHAELLAAATAPAPQVLTRMVVAGELLRPGVAEAVNARYGVPLGTMYGMTELGVIATDLFGKLRPGYAPAPGMDLRVADGELLVRMAASPYIGLVDPTRWSDGWLHTRDAATIDVRTGLVTILGRLDSQVSVGGLKVDLTEVEQTLGALPGVDEAVVLYDVAIEAYVALREGTTVPGVEAALSERLAAYKRPREVHVLARLPRTATGKIVRDRRVLRAQLGSQPGADA
ncbi:MAG TPA: class I adenylate-forming enzyme family protein [Streptosporangiaceae bacterium]|nr:class I adenylate-forming enzyme family protein [Streptosporangiaceae bacterium]